MRPGAGDTLLNVRLVRIAKTVNGGTKKKCDVEKPIAINPKNGI